MKYSTTTLAFIGSYNNGGSNGYYYMNWIWRHTSYDDGLNMYYTSLAFADDNINIYGLISSDTS